MKIFQVLTHTNEGSFFNSRVLSCLDHSAFWTLRRARLSNVNSVASLYVQGVATIVLLLPVVPQDCHHLLGVMAGLWGIVTLRCGGCKGSQDGKDNLQEIQC